MQRGYRINFPNGRQKFTQYLDKYSLPGYLWDEIAGAALIDPSIITGQKQLYMDIDVDRGASYGKSIFWDSTAQVPPYLRLANVQFDIDAKRFYKIYIDLMTRPARSANSHTHTEE
jgi:purine nucleosidase